MLLCARPGWSDRRIKCSSGNAACGGYKAPEKSGQTTQPSCSLTAPLLCSLQDGKFCSVSSLFQTFKDCESRSSKGSSLTGPIIFFLKLVYVKEVGMPVERQSQMIAIDLKTTSPSEESQQRALSHLYHSFRILSH